MRKEPYEINHKDNPVFQIPQEDIEILNCDNCNDGYCKDELFKYGKETLCPVCVAIIETEKAEGKLIMFEEFKKQLLSGAELKDLAFTKEDSMEMCNARIAELKKQLNIKE